MASDYHRVEAAVDQAAKYTHPGVALVVHHRMVAGRIGDGGLVGSFHSAADPHHLFFASTLELTL